LKIEANKMRILIVSMQGIGNTALLLPVIRKIAVRDKCELDIAVSNNGSAHILLNNPDIRRIYVWDEKKNGLHNLLRLRKELKPNKYDAVYSAFPNWSRENAVALIAASGKKTGYAGDKKYLSDRIICGAVGINRKRPEKQHDMLSNLNLFEFGSGPVEISGPLFYYSAQEAGFNENLAKKYLSGEDSPIIGLHPGSKALEKRWAGKKFGELAVKISEKYGRVKFLIFGSAGEKEEMDIVREAIRDKAQSLAELSLRQAAWFIGKCDILIGNDSAPVHLAALQGIPAVAITGPADYLRTSPVGGKSVVIRKDLACSPCYGRVYNIRKECAHDLKCINDISSDEVFGVADKCLEAIIADSAGFDCAKIKWDTLKVRREDLFSGAVALNLEAKPES